ncbi:MAG: hypothetical protein LBR82_02065 [Desulfovibrio sp.]|jgi:hypothetical protein|nr:hypothetical protein [Desulfovibrio sp.]
MINTVSTDAFLPHILPMVIGCPKSMAVDALQVSIGEFCKRSEAWTDVLTESVYTGDSTIDLNPGGNRIVARVLGLSIDGARIDNKAYFAQVYSIILRFAPSSNAVAYVTVALRPSRTATHVPQFLYDEWCEPIASGAVFRLKMMTGPKITWSDPQGAVYHQKVAIEGTAEARARQMRCRYGDGGSIFLGA